MNNASVNPPDGIVESVALAALEKVLGTFIMHQVKVRGVLNRFILCTLYSWRMFFFQTQIFSHKSRYKFIVKNYAFCPFF